MPVPGAVLLWLCLLYTSHVVAHLFFAAAVALFDGVAHRVGAVVGIEDDVAVRMPRRTRCV